MSEVDPVRAAPPDPYDAFRSTARRLLVAGVAPDEAAFDAGGQPPLFGTVAPADVSRTPTRAIPRALQDLLADAACHADPQRYGVMYRVLWRAWHGERDVLDALTDDDVRRLRGYAREVRHEIHRMHAFVRFRLLPGATPRYVAWMPTEHDVLRRAAAFFVDRFATMHWTIATPHLTAQWDGRALAFGPAPDHPPPPPDDDTESLWLAYYDSIFNPARVNERLMRREMPVRYWGALPEARRIPVLIAAARERTATMIGHTSAPDGGLRAAPPKREAPPTDFGPDDRPLKARVDACRRCDLYKNATQGVAGRGPARAKLMLVGEQPGDEEDLAGEPFVGPAGRLLAKALDEAGVDPARVYVTNAVKHFKWEPRGKRRIHKTPAQREVEACHVWLDGEIARERPRVLVALGATALGALLERKMSIRDARGTALVHTSGATIVATYHPSAALRAPTPELREQTYSALVEDLRRAQAEAGPASGSGHAAR